MMVATNASAVILTTSAAAEEKHSDRWQTRYHVLYIPSIHSLPPQNQDGFKSLLLEPLTHLLDVNG